MHCLETEKKGSCRGAVTPPKRDMDTQNYRFFKGISGFKYGHFGYPCKGLGEKKAASSIMFAPRCKLEWDFPLLQDGGDQSFWFQQLDTHSFWWFVQWFWCQAVKKKVIQYIFCKVKVEDSNTKSHILTWLLYRFDFLPSFFEIQGSKQHQTCFSHVGFYTNFFAPRSGTSRL